MNTTIETMSTKPVNQLLADIRTLSETLIEKYGEDLSDRSIFYTALPALDDRLLTVVIMDGNLRLNYGEQFQGENVGIIFKGQKDPEYYGGGVKTFFHRLLGRQPTLESLDLYEKYLNLAKDAESEKG